MELLDYHCFADLTDDEKDALAHAAKSVMLPSKHILYYEGDVCADVLFLKSGSVRIYIQPRQVGSEEMTLYELKPGGQCVVNLFSTITAQPTLANAQTITAIEGWLVPRQTIKSLIDSSAAYREFKIDIVGQRMTALVNLLSDVKFTNVEEQLLNWLYVQGMHTIKITHDKIASIIGVTRETVSRNLKKLEQKGHIKLSRGKILIVG